MYRLLHIGLGRYGILWRNTPLRRLLKLRWHRSMGWNKTRIRLLKLRRYRIPGRNIAWNRLLHLGDRWLLRRYISSCRRLGCRWGLLGDDMTGCSPLWGRYCRRGCPRIRQCICRPLALGRYFGRHGGLGRLWLGQWFLFFFLHLADAPFGWKWKNGQSRHLSAGIPSAFEDILYCFILDYRSHPLPAVPHGADVLQIPCTHALHCAPGSGHGEDG